MMFDENWLFKNIVENFKIENHTRTVLRIRHLLTCSQPPNWKTVLGNLPKIQKTTINNKQYQILDIWNCVFISNFWVSLFICVYVYRSVNVFQRLLTSIMKTHQTQIHYLKNELSWHSNSKFIRRIFSIQTHF